MSSRFRGLAAAAAVLGASSPSAPTHPEGVKDLPGMLPEGAMLSVYHDAAAGMSYLVVQESRFDLSPKSIPIPAQLVTAIYARILNDSVNAMGGVAPVPGIVPICAMVVGPAPTPT